MMNTIIDPNTNQKYSLFSKKGKKILKNLLRSHKGGVFQPRRTRTTSYRLPIRQGRRLPVTEDDRQRQNTFDLIANRLRNQQYTTPQGQAFSLRNVRQNITEGIPNLVESLRLLHDQQYNVIRGLSGHLHESFDNSDSPHPLRVLEFFSENELQNLRRNNITTVPQLTATYLSFMNDDVSEIDLIMRMYRFLQSLLDNNNDDVRRAIRILSLIDFISSQITIIYPDFPTFPYV